MQGQRFLFELLRTGTVAACVLKGLGLPVEDSLRRVREAGSNPQSAVQSGWVEQF